MTDPKPFTPMSDLEIAQWIDEITRPPPSTPEELLDRVRERIHQVRLSRVRRPKS
jgi:hypothetical protein